MNNDNYIEIKEMKEIIKQMERDVERLKQLSVILVLILAAFAIIEPYVL